MLGGNPKASGTKDLFQIAPIFYVTPQNEAWRRVLESEFSTRIAILPFTDFSSVALDPSYLARLVQAIHPDFELKRLDKRLAEQLPLDIGNEFFFENFQSVEDFLSRGIGYCITHRGRIVSAATSMAKSRTAMDIEIETTTDYQRQGLGTVVGAKLVLQCLEQRVEPRWLAANIASEKLAMKLGFVRGETYQTYEMR